MPAHLAPLYAALALAYCAVLEGVTAIAIAQMQPVWSSGGLRAWCVIGSVLGGLLAVCIWIPEGSNAQLAFRRLLVKFLGSTISGLLFAPAIARYLEVQIDEDWVMAISGGVAFVSVWLIHLVMPIGEAVLKKLLVRKADKYLGDE